jgi:ABC-type uncharacterized transport system auxiliary subunit
VKKIIIIAVIAISLIFMFSCARPLAKQYYLLNYTYDNLQNRKSETPYGKIIRLRPFGIEKVYAKPGIVYRESPYKLNYYNDHLWAVRPVDMISDLIFNHIERVNLVKTVVRRLDETVAPDYELSGTILAIEEYDSDELWYAHLKISVVLTDFNARTTVYSRIFDQTRKVETHNPISVVKTLSEIMDYTASMLMIDLDNFFYEQTKNKNDDD